MEFICEKQGIWFEREQAEGGNGSQNIHIWLQYVTPAVRPWLKKFYISL